MLWEAKWRILGSKRLELVTKRLKFVTPAQVRLGSYSRYISSNLVQVRSSSNVKEVTPSTVEEVTPSKTDEVPTQGYTNQVPPPLTESKPGKKAGPKKPKKTKPKKIYGWEHYKALDWTEIKKGNLPKDESWKTLLLGAYTMSLHHFHGVEVVIDGSDFNGKIGQNALDCFRFFHATNDHDNEKAIRAALDWITWFTKQPVDSFVGEASWAIELCFSKAQYRKFAGMKKSGGPARKDPMKRNDSAGEINSPEDLANAKEERF